jgi:hypothetical protein
MAASRTVPLITLGIGVAIAAVNGIALVGWNTYFPKFLAAVPVFVLLGVAMLIFPGAEAPSGVEGADKTNHYWKAAPTSRKAIWIAFGAVGLAIGLYFIHRLGYFSR